MNGITDLYVKEEIMAQCESHFAEYLKKENDTTNKLTNDDLDLVRGQLDAIFDLIDDILFQFREQDLDDMEAYSHVIDQLIGYCILSKMNEVRLCNTIDLMLKEKE